MSHKLDAGKTRLRSLVGAAKAASPVLPLVHSTDSYALEDVLTDGQMKPQGCGVFEGESLTYLFYGRPAFRPNADAEPSGLGHYLPVCLLFKPDWAVKVRRVFPFDSGAFQNGIYGAYLHRRMKLGDFGLEPDMTTPGKVISQFFGSVSAYLKARPEIRSNFDPAEFEAQSYHALVNAKGGNAIDDRGASVEVQTADTIPIADAVAAVVLPSTFVDGSTGKRLAALSVEILPYRVIDKMRPSEFMSQIPTLCIEYYIRTGLVDKADL